MCGMGDGMQRCQLEIVFSPARQDLAGIGSRLDLGGFVYRVRDDEGRLRISGSVNTLDPLTAFARAKRVASDAGFAEWRGWNAGGPYHKIEESK